jgi:hypothetical protein
VCSNSGLDLHFRHQQRLRLARALLRCHHIRLPKSLIHLGERFDQRSLSHRVSRIGNGPVALILAGVGFLVVESLPLGPDQAVDDVVQVHLSALRVRGLSSQAGVARSSRDFLGRISIGLRGSQ